MNYYLMLILYFSAGVHIGILRREMGRHGGLRRSECLGRMILVQLVTIAITVLFAKSVNPALQDTQLIYTFLLSVSILLTIIAHVGPLHGETMTMGDHPSYSAVRSMSVMALRFTVQCLIIFGAAMIVNPNVLTTAMPMGVYLIVSTAICIGTIPGSIYYITKYAFSVKNYTEVSEFLYPCLYTTAIFWTVLQLLVH